MELVPETVEEHSVTQSSFGKAGIAQRKRAGGGSGRRQTGVFAKGPRPRKSTHYAIDADRINKQETLRKSLSLRKDNPNPRNKKPSRERGQSLHKRRESSSQKAQ